MDGIIPISASITKDTAQLELASITRAIKPMWRNEVNLKRALPWTMCKWDEYGGMFVTWPGGNAGNQYCAVVNIATGAWARFTGWDAMCFGRMRGDMFFGTQLGKIMQADRTGYDNGVPYTATMVGGWEMFSSQSMTMVWRQARAAFHGARRRAVPAATVGDHRLRHRHSAGAVGGARSWHAGCLGSGPVGDDAAGCRADVSGQVGSRRRRQRRPCATLAGYRLATPDFRMRRSCR